MPVVLMMTDGLRPDAISEAQTPNLYRFMQRGAWTLRGRSVIPSITLPCHLSIFYSAPPAEHGTKENNFIPMNPTRKGLIEHLRDQERRCALVHNWEPLRDLNRPGWLEYSFFINTGYDLDGDEIMAQTARTVLDDLRPDFLFVYFASVDVAGHIHNWMSDEYLQQATLVDALIGQLLDHIPADTHILIHSDHGGHDNTHGTELAEDMTIPWMIAGPGIRQGYEIQRPVSLLDTAPTVAACLEVAPNPEWRGAVVQEVFETG